MPLVGVLCPGFTSLWFCMGYTEEAPDTGVTSPAQKLVSETLKKTPRGCFFSYLNPFPRFLVLTSALPNTHTIFLKK